MIGFLQKRVQFIRQIMRDCINLSDFQLQVDPFLLNLQVIFLFIKINLIKLKEYISTDKFNTYTYNII